MKVILTSSPVSVKNFAFLDPSLNFSDHLPLTATISCTVTPAKVKCPSNKNKSYDQPRLRWDRADKVSYYNFTAACFPDILVKLRDFAVSSISLGCDQTVSAFMDAIYDEIVCVLQRAASLYVVIKIANYLFVNVYLPCVGTCDRLMICDDILDDINFVLGMSVSLIVN